MKKTPVKEATQPSGLAFLIESELEKAEVVLAAQAIAKKLTDMAADLSKIEADDIMPILDNMRLTFGPELTDSFNDITTAKVRQTMEAVKAAKEAVSKEIARMEAAVNGEMSNDMGLDGPGGEGDLGLDGDMATGGDEAGDLGAELDAAAPAGDDAAAAIGDVPAPDTEEGGADELDAAFADAGDSAAGRAKKESVERNVKALRESKNPDRLIFETFRRTLKESKGQAVRAAQAVATAFQIDYADVVEIVKEAAVQEGKTRKDEKGRSDKNKDRSDDRRAKKRERDVELDEGKTHKDEKGRSDKNKDRSDERKAKKREREELDETEVTEAQFGDGAKPKAPFGKRKPDPTAKVPNDYRDMKKKAGKEVDESAAGAKVLVTPKSKDKPFSKPFKVPAAKK